jgi:hypothetical protein
MRRSGLSKRLTFVRIDAVDPEPTTPWAVKQLSDGSRWVTYGSLLRGEDGAHDDSETDACRRARTRLRAADAALLRRLDFDPESAGTGISAASREDLQRALTILGLTS